MMSRSMLILMCLTTILLSGCSYSESAASSVIEEASTNSDTLQEAKQYLADVKDKIREDYDESYFNSKEWHAFVDSFWASYNEQQKYAKQPDLMPTDQIVY